MNGEAARLETDCATYPHLRECERRNYKLVIGLIALIVIVDRNWL